MRKLYGKKYHCGKCHCPVYKWTKICPRCHTVVMGIQCTHCGYRGKYTEWINDLCPKCGKKNNNTENDEKQKTVPEIPKITTPRKTKTHIISKRKPIPIKLYCLILGIIAIICIIIFILYFKLI